jgi:cytochrome c553
MRNLVLAALFLSTSSALAAPDARTQRAWKAKCAPCHGDDGKGQTEAGKKMGVTDMTSPTWQKRLTDDQIKSAMVKGVKEKREGKDVEMPAVPDLKPEVIDALAAMIRGFGK